MSLPQCTFALQNHRRIGEEHNIIHHSMPESLSGLIERVTFHNENGWTVLKIKAKGHCDLATVVGSLPSVSPGEWITAQGGWGDGQPVKRSKTCVGHGWQIRLR